MKRCFKCGNEKALTEFYAHRGMKDGHLNKCKDCTKNDIRLLEKTPERINKERARGREKYYRLYRYQKTDPELKRIIVSNYKQKYPEKQKAKGVSNKIQTPFGFNNHHWSYNQEHWMDIIQLEISEHMKLHRYMIYDQERMMYRTLDGVLLDSKGRHIEYYNSIKNKP